MSRVLERYGVPFAAIIVIIIVGVVAAGGVLANQRFYLPKWVPVIGSDFVDYTIDFPTAKAVVPGQGQTVSISGVTIGEVSDVQLVDRRGRVTVKIRDRYTDLIHADASADLRPRTPLQDMIIQLDPGTKSAPLLPPGGNIPAARTMTPVEVDDIISTFDADTRQYLAILLDETGKGFDGEGGAQFGELLRSFEPTATYASRLGRAFQDRDANIRRAVTNLGRVATVLAENDRELASFIRSNSRAFSAIGQSQADLRRVARAAPDALRSTQDLLERGGTLAVDAGRATRRLQQPSARLDEGFARLTELFDVGTPVVRDSLRPFARDVQDPLRRLRPGVEALAAASRSAQTGTGVLRNLTDGLAYDPPGPALPALTLGAFLGHNTNSLTSTSDAAGSVGRSLLYSDCGLIGISDAVRSTGPTGRVTSDVLGIPRPETRLSNGQTAQEYCGR